LKASRSEAFAPTLENHAEIFDRASYATLAVNRVAIAPSLVPGWMSQRQLARGLAFGAGK